MFQSLYEVHPELLIMVKTITLYFSRIAVSSILNVNIKNNLASKILVQGVYFVP